VIPEKRQKNSQKNVLGVRHRIRKAMPLLLAKRRSLFRREVESIIEYFSFRVNQPYDDKRVVLLFYTVWSFVLLLA
jgi:hypothetical protein